MFLLDTNVVSELRKLNTRKINAGVEAWAQSTAGEQTYISVVTIFELERGILRVERKDPTQGAMFRKWFNGSVLNNYTGRIISFDTDIALRCASLHIPDPKSDYDAIIAATAIEHSLTVVTRNTTDFEQMGVGLLNPWTE